MREYLDDLAIRDEIKMLERTSKNKNVYVVEGVTDSRILKSIFGVADDRIVVAGSKQYVLASAADAEIVRCLFFVDKDFDETDFGGRVVVTDFYDIEHFLIRSEKISIILAEFCSNHKIANTNVVAEVDAVAEYFAKLKFARRELDRPVAFAPEAIIDVVSNTVPYIPTARLKGRLAGLGLAAGVVDRLLSRVDEVEFKDGTERNLSTKVWVAVFCKFVRGRFGSLSGQQADFEHMSRVFRCALEKSCFQGSKWLKRAEALDIGFGK